jgi:FkbM family methyltransferase
MNPIGKVRRAFDRGGISEVARLTRLKFAKPAAAKPTPEPEPEPIVQPASAIDVEPAVALAWFETRRAQYIKLAHAVAPHIHPQGMVLDVGANIGYFTKILTEVTNFRGTVHMFEPVPHLARIIPTTLSDANFDFQVHNIGLSDSPAELTLYVDLTGNLGWNTLVADKTTEGMKEITISVQPFSSLNLKHVPTFIKIDVEGAEHHVINGMIDAIAGYEPKPVILCEVGWGISHPQWEEELAAFTKLTDLGYRTTDLEGAPLDVTAINQTTDILFMPAGLT